MGEYHFSAELAQQYGLDEAIMLHNLAYWMRKNALDGRNIHDGQVWTFSSLEAFTEWFPFWSVKQIRRILASLEQQALIRKGNYNKRATDRTTWYTITSWGIMAFPTQQCPPKRTIPFAQMGRRLCPNGRMILPIRAQRYQRINTKRKQKKHTLPVRACASEISSTSSGRPTLGRRARRKPGRSGRSSTLTRRCLRRSCPGWTHTSAVSSGGVGSSRTPPPG